MTRTNVVTLFIRTMYLFRCHLPCNMPHPLHRNLDPINWRKHLVTEAYLLREHRVSLTGRQPKPIPMKYSSRQNVMINLLYVNAKETPALSPPKVSKFKHHEIKVHIKSTVVDRLV